MLAVFIYFFFFFFIRSKIRLLRKNAFRIRGVCISILQFNQIIIGLSVSVLGLWCLQPYPFERDKCEGKTTHRESGAKSKFVFSRTTRFAFGAPIKITIWSRWAAQQRQLLLFAAHNSGARARALTRSYTPVARTNCDRMPFQR